MKKQGYIFLIGMAVSLTLQAQTSITFTNLPLPAPYESGALINGIAFDSSGDMWLATQTDRIGAMKYSDTTWTYFYAVEHSHDGGDDVDDTLHGLGNAHSSCIMIDEKDAIWFGSSGHGISKLLDTSWTTYNVSKGLANGMVMDILGVNDTVWIATKGGLNRLVGDTNWTTYRSEIADTVATCLALDLSGNLWVGTPTGVCIFNGSSWAKHHPVTGSNDNNYILALAVDKEGNIWAAIYESGIWMYNGSWKKQFEHAYLNTIAFDRQGNLWTASSNIKDTLRGVWRYDGNSWTHYSKQDGLYNNMVLSMGVDKEGHVWLGFVGGLTKVEVLPNYILEQKQENPITVYPNPASAQFRVSAVANAEIRIYTMVGQQISVIWSMDETITVDATDWVQGIYLLYIEKDKQVTIRKIQISR
jgi:ligand-binding sensor domain-containing protein